MKTPKMAKNWNNTDKTELYERIINSRFIFGKTYSQIAEENGVSDTFSNITCIAFEAVKKKDWKKVKHLITNNGQSYLLFDWSAKKLGIELPPEIMQTYIEAKKIDAEKKRVRSEKKKQTIDAVETEPKTTQAPAETQPEVIAETATNYARANQDNTALCMCKILTALSEQNELLEQLLDVVFPKYIGDIKDNINANFDILTGEVKACADKLEGIKINTRKRGL